MGKKFLAEVETDEYYHVEIKELSKSEYISKDKIREKINKVDKLLEDYDKKFTDPLVPYEIRSYYDGLIRIKSVLKDLLEENKSNENNI